MANGYLVSGRVTFLQHLFFLLEKLNSNFYHSWHFLSKMLHHYHLMGLKMATKSKSRSQVDDKCLVLKLARSSQGIVRRRRGGGGRGEDWCKWWCEVRREHNRGREGKGTTTQNYNRLKLNSTLRISFTLSVSPSLSHCQVQCPIYLILIIVLDRKIFRWMEDCKTY